MQVIDDDRVTEANLGRQLFAESELGQYKAAALVSRINRFFGTNWRAIPQRFFIANEKNLPNHGKASIYLSGSQKLDVSSSSTMVRLYNVTNASALGASIAISTTKLIDTIRAMDQSFIYSSAKAADPNSAIQMGLQSLARVKLQVGVDNKGRILETRPPVKLNDTLVSFSGIQPEYFQAGTTLPFLANFPAGSSLKKGYSWSANTPKAQTTYTIYATTPRTTTITYKSSELEKNLNSRINGTMIIDNNTGMVLKRYSQTVSTGYEMVNGVVYTATRRTAITETCTKK